MLSFSLVIFLLMFSLKLNLLMFIEFTPHVHLVMSNQGTESNLCQNMMMGKSIFETSKHPAFKGSNDTFGVKFLLAGKQVREEQAK